MMILPELIRDIEIKKLGYFSRAGIVLLDHEHEMKYEFCLQFPILL